MSTTSLLSAGRCVRGDNNVAVFSFFPPLGVGVGVVLGFLFKQKAAEKKGWKDGRNEGRNGRMSVFLLL